MLVTHRWTKQITCISEFRVYQRLFPWYWGREDREGQRKEGEEEGSKAKLRLNYGVIMALRRNSNGCFGWEFEISKHQSIEREASLLRSWELSLLMLSVALGLHYWALWPVDGSIIPPFFLLMFHKIWSEENYLDCYLIHFLDIKTNV